MKSDGSRPAAGPGGCRLARVRRLAVTGLPLLAAALIAAPAQADVDDQFFFFPAAGYTWRAEDPAGDQKKHAGELGLDLFYTADANGVRLLAEVFANTGDETELEVERLELSWPLWPGSRLWLGRYHNPIGYWNTEYHHGTFLQPSIARPGIVEFEDDGGVLPMHITGARLEGHVVRAGSVWRYDLALGAGPEMNAGLHPVEVHKPGVGSHDLSLTARLSWQPENSIDQLGVYAGFNKVPGAASTPADVRQRLAGLFANWHFGAYTEVLAAAYVVRNELWTPGLTTQGAFRNGFIQLEQVLGINWTAYGRAEGTASGSGDAYLDLFDGFVRERQLVGLRYEVASNQAVKVEISKYSLPGGKRDQLDIQWSAVYP